MKHSNPTFTLTSLAAALLASYGAGATAAEDEVTRLTEPDSSVTVGIGYWSGDRQQFGIYDNLTGDDTLLLFDADIRQRDDATGTWMTGKIRDLGIDTRDAELRYERQGNWGVGLDYSQLPRIAPYEVNSGVTGIGSELQTVPPSIVPGTGADVTLKTERKNTGLLFYKYLAPHLNFKINFNNEEKDGNRHWGYYPGFGQGGGPAFVAEPIDSTTRQLEGVLEYAGRQFQLTGGYYGSWYDNHNSLLAVEGNGNNPPYYLSLPLDNQAHQFFVNGGYNFTPTTRGTFRVAYTHATQDDELPTAAVAGLADPGAPDSLEGEVNTTVVQLGLTARPIDKLNLVANLRYHNVDDQTPEWLVVPGGTVHTKPNDYETYSGKLEATYRLPQDYSLIGGVEYRKQNRSRSVATDVTWVPFAERLKETTYRVQLRKSLSATLNGSLAFLYSARDGSQIVPASAGAVENQINPINVADRDRSKWRLTVDWIALDNLGLQFNFEDSQDDYGPGSNPYGLTEGSARLFSVDADYTINPDWRLTAWASWDQTKASEEYNNRSSDLKDSGQSFGLGIDGRATAKLTIGAKAQYTRTESEYDDRLAAGASYPGGGAGTVTPLPDITNEATKLSLFAEYAVHKNGDLRLDLAYEKWDTDDWTWQFSDGSPFVYGTTQDGTMITQDPDQSATFVGVSYKYKWQ